MSLKAELQHKIDNKTKPLGSLGLLEDIALQIGLIQNTLTPSLQNPAMLVFAGDHGLADEGVSLFPKEVTVQMVMNYFGGGAAINVFCNQHNILLKVVDAGVAADFEPHPSLINAKVGYGTKNILHAPAMTITECEQCLDKADKIISDLAKEGTNIIGFGEMGIGNTSSAALLMSRYLNIPVEICAGRGTGHEGEGLKRKIEILMKANASHPAMTDPKEILATFGGFEVAMIAGAILSAYQHKMAILIDGFIASSALLAASKINPNVLDNCIFCHQSNEQGHRLMLDHFNARPLLNIGMRLGEGTGAAVAFPLVQSAVNFLNEMASFESAGVSKGI